MVSVEIKQTNNPQTVVTEAEAADSSSIQEGDGQTSSKITSLTPGKAEAIPASHATLKEAVIRVTLLTGMLKFISSLYLWTMSFFFSSAQPKVEDTGASILTSGSVSTKGKDAYSMKLDQLLKEDLLPKKELQTEIKIDIRGLGEFGNLFGLEEHYEKLAVPLDRQFIKDISRQVIDIKGKEFVNNEKRTYLDQNLQAAIAKDQETREADEPMPAMSFLAKAFIQKLKDEFGATDEEIMALSYLISQRATFFIADMFGSGQLGLPEGTAAFNVDSRFSITKSENVYQVVAYYELENPPFLLISNEKESRTYIYEQTESRQDFVKVSVALDFEIKEGKPDVRLADEGIKYDIRLTATEGGQWG